VCGARATRKNGRLQQGHAQRLRRRHGQQALPVGIIIATTAAVADALFGDEVRVLEQDRHGLVGLGATRLLRRQSSVQNGRAHVERCGA